MSDLFAEVLFSSYFFSDFCQLPPSSTVSCTFRNPSLLFAARGSLWTSIRAHFRHKCSRFTLGIKELTLRINGITLGINGITLSINEITLGINGITLGINGITLGINGITLGINGITLGINGNPLGFLWGFFRVPLPSLPILDSLPTPPHFQHPELTTNTQTQLNSNAKPDFRRRRRDNFTTYHRKSGMPIHNNTLQFVWVLLQVM